MAQSTQQKLVLVKREWGVFPIGEGGLQSCEVGAFLKTAERAARKLRLPEGAVLSRVVGGLKAGQVCGVLSYQGRSLEILPKIDGTGSDSRLALVNMLSVVHDLRISDGELTQLQTQRRSILELLIALFIRRLIKAMRSGLQRQYMRHQDDLHFVRGTIDIKRQLTKRPSASARLFCEFDELSENTPLNRMLKAVVLRLHGISSSSESKRHLQTILDVLRNVDFSSHPLKEAIQIDRSAAAYADIIPLARLLLSGDWQNTTSGHTTGTALLFPMNELFERYIARRAQQALGKNLVHKQHFRHHALSNKLFRIIPDIVVDYQIEPVIIDTKWKQLENGDRQKLGVLQADIYQMLAYGHSYAANGNKPRLVLLYPHHAALEKPEGVLRRWSVTGSELPLTVASLNISKQRSPEQWLELFNLIAPKPVITKGC